MSVLEINNIRKNFGDKEVLKGIDLKVEEGEVVSILGPSGSGKSTLLRCATFLEKADGGTISYCDEEVVKTVNGTVTYPGKKKLKWAREQFGLVFQNFNLFPHFTVRKNVSDAPIVNQKRDPDEVRKTVEGLLEKVGLSEEAESYPCQLSGGQQQRVAIARALAMAPKMLFFDEPTSALDPEITAEILRVLKKLAEEKITMVIVTHEIDFARAVSDRVIFIDDGVIIEEGAPEDVIDNPENERTQLFLKKLSL